jgi:hypothetical protein
VNVTWKPRGSYTDRSAVRIYGLVRFCSPIVAVGTLP